MVVTLAKMATIVKLDNQFIWIQFCCSSFGPNSIFGFCSDFSLTLDMTWAPAQILSLPLLQPHFLSLSLSGSSFYSGSASSSSS